jgi:hypothetical protein
LVDSLIKRGEKWMKLYRAKPTTMYYDGPLTPFLVAQKNLFDSSPLGDEEQVRAQNKPSLTTPSL